MGESQDSNKTPTLAPALLNYILETSAYPQEHEQLKELRTSTVDKYKSMSVVSVPVDEAQLLSMLLKLMNAKKTIEIGVFTGYSLLATALALPPDGQIVAIDPNEEAFSTGLPFFKKAGVDHKINYIASDGSLALRNLIEEKEEEEEEEGRFDFAFVDANKEGYTEYHELLMKLVKVGGIIAYDNTLWLGSVSVPTDEEMEEFVRNNIETSNEVVKELLKKGRKALRIFNSFLTKDSRIESVLTSIGDGLTICRRIK